MPTAAALSSVRAGRRQSGAAGQTSEMFKLEDRNSHLPTPRIDMKTAKIVEKTYTQQWP
jgi:hypothetical protein